MDGTEVQWIGSNCGRHGSYTFYRGFRLTVDDKVKNYCLGEFYFVRNSCEQPICIAELQLVWYDANTEDKLASVRLYFCPKDTPFGRQTSHGQDELLYADQKVVIKCADMVSWHCSGLEWKHGLVALNESNFVQTNGSFLLSYASLSNNNDSLEDKHTTNKGTSKIIILTFPAYCRYRALLKRLSESHLTKTQILALGGIVASDGTTRIMFCRDCFHHPTLDEFELSGETKAPVLKGRPRRKKKLRGVPAANVLKKKKFLADIQNCLSEDQGLTKRLKTSDEEDTESDRSEVSVKSYESTTEKPKLPVQKQGPAPKPAIAARPVKVEDILTHDGLAKSQSVPLVVDTNSKVPPLISTSMAKKITPGHAPKLCLPLQGAVQSFKQTSTPLKTDLKPPPLNSFTKTSNPSKNISIKQELVACIKKDKNSERLPSVQHTKLKPLEGLVKANAPTRAVSICGSSPNSMALATSGVTTVVKTEVWSAPDGKQPRCQESQGTLSDEKDTEGKENVKEQAPKKRKRLRQPGDIKDGLEEYDDEDEKFFMHSLRDFMKTRNTPIGKIPALGFKKVNLWTMYNTTQKLGGYDMVTSKRLWRYVYDSLGGSTTITSAATYSRRHYERLLLPYERYVRSQLMEKKEKKSGVNSSSPRKAGLHGKPPVVSANQDHVISVGVPVSSCPPSPARSVNSSDTATARPPAVSSKKVESCSRSQNKLGVAEILLQGEGMNSGGSDISLRDEAVLNDQLSKVSTERRAEVTRTPTSAQSKVAARAPAVATVRPQSCVERKDVPSREAQERPLALSRQHHDVPQRAPPKEQHEVPRVPSREQHEVPRVPSREQHEVPRVPSREQHEVPRVPSMEQHEVPRVPSREQHEVPRVHSREQHEVPRVPSREQHKVPRAPSREPREVSRVPSRETYNGLQMSSQSQRDVPRSVSREHNNVPKVQPKDRCNTSRSLPREQHGVPKVTKEQHGVPRVSSKSQHNVLHKSAQDRQLAAGKLSKEQRGVTEREQCDGVRRQSEGHPQDRQYTTRSHAEANPSTKMTHEASKRPTKTRHDFQGVSSRLSGEHLFHPPEREQENALSRNLEVSHLNQLDIRRTPSREQRDEPPSRGLAAKVTHLTQNDVPRLPSRDGLTGPKGGEKAPVMNEHAFPRGRLDVHTSVGVIDLTNDDIASDFHSVYASQASTPFTSTFGFNGFSHAFTAYDLGRAMLSEPQSTMQQIQQAVCKSRVPDQQSASVSQSHHELSASKPHTDRAAALHAAREKADHAHKKARQRFHPYPDERRVTHSSSLESADKHFDEWQRRCAPHALFGGMQTPSEQAAFHFFSSPYARMPREPERSQERRKESTTEQTPQPQQLHPNELNSHYADAMAFPSCLSPASVSDASAFAMRATHAPTLKEDLASSIEQLYPTSRIFMPSPHLFNPQVPMEMVPISPSVLTAGPLIAGSEEQFHIHPHCLMATPYAYAGGSASIPYPLHSFT